jgi:aminoglycoside phosphotransferase (APT) family kinase protein
MEREIAAAVAVAEEYGFRCEEPRVVNRGFNLLLELRPHPIVARIPTVVARIRKPFENASVELAFASALEAAGIGAARPSSLLRPGPHRRGGVVVSFWELLVTSSRQSIAAEEAGRMLRAIHELDPAQLPFLPPFRPPLELDLLLERVRSERLLEAAALELIEEERARLARLVPDGLDARPLHGDAHYFNLVQTANSPVWIDLEDCCLGPVEWDLATVQFGARRLGRNDPAGEMLQGYGANADSELLEAMLDLRMILNVAWHAIGAADIPECTLWRDRYLELLFQSRGAGGGAEPKL